MAYLGREQCNFQFSCRLKWKLNLDKAVLSLIRVSWIALLDLMPWTETPPGPTASSLCISRYESSRLYNLQCCSLWAQTCIFLHTMLSRTHCLLVHSLAHGFCLTPSMSPPNWIWWIWRGQRGWERLGWVWECLTTSQLARHCFSEEKSRWDVVTIHCKCGCVNFKFLFNVPTLQSK